MTKHFLPSGAALLLAAVAFAPAAALAAALAIDFESYAPGTVHGKDGWSSAGAFDQEVTAGFDGQALRISNAVTSGSFGDQTFSKSLIDEAGEASAENSGLSGGIRQPYFEAEWEFASARPGEYQPDLSVVASPDRGDGARMSWVQMADTPEGLAVNFYDYQDGAFVESNVASGLSRSVPHTVKITMEFVEGPENDVVNVYVDGTLRHTGTSWEDYFRNVEGNPTRTVDSILFRTAGTAAPDAAGAGFFIDNFTAGSGPTKSACKKNGWSFFNFFNQGDCISSIVTP